MLASKLVVILPHRSSRPCALRFVSTLQPDGALVITTLNRTAASFWLGIVGAEYASRLVPAGTHEWARFITPDELRSALAERGLVSVELTGLTFNPLTGRWATSGSTAVNYGLIARRLPDRLPSAA